MEIYEIQMTIEGAVAVDQYKQVNASKNWWNHINKCDTLYRKWTLCPVTMKFVEERKRDEANDKEGGSAIACGHNDFRRVEYLPIYTTGSDCT